MPRASRLPRWAALVLLAGCSASASEAAVAPLATTTSTTVATTTSAPAETSTTITVPVTPTRGDGLVDELVVAPEHLEGYDRDRFEHWIDADHDRCNTRCEVLEAERRPDVGWVSIYDGLVTRDPALLEIDHVVALAEAWRSGAWGWDDARREAFANDLDEPGALIAVSSRSNQSKADKDPAEWRPPLQASWCEWAGSWTRVKIKWDLTADPAEVEALRAILAGC